MIVELIDIIVEYTTNTNIYSKLFDIIDIQRNRSHINWKKLCGNKLIPVEIFESFVLNIKLRKHIEWDDLCGNSNIPFSFFEKCMNDPDIRNEIHIEYLCKNENISVSFLETCIENDIKLDWNNLILNKTIDFSFFMKYQYRFKEYEFNDLYFKFLLRSCKGLKSNKCALGAFCKGLKSDKISDNLLSVFTVFVNKYADIFKHIDLKNLKLYFGILLKTYNSEQLFIEFIENYISHSKNFAMINEILNSEVVYEAYDNLYKTQLKSVFKNFS